MQLRKVVDDTIKKQPLEKKTNRLRHLDSITPEKLTELEQQYSRSAQELDSIIDDYWKSYWVELVANYLGIATNLLYMVFQATTIKSGIDGSVHILSPDTKVPSAVSSGLGGFLAGGGLVFIFSISAKNEAVIAILDYALRDPLQKRITQTLKSAADNKARTFINTFQAIAHQSVLLGTYTTGALSEILPIIDYLNTRTSFEKWLAIAAIQYFGCRYSSSYATPSYYEGVKFWQNEKGRPYLIHEMLKGNMATPLQVFFQGIISTSLLRAFPNYFWVAKAGKEALGSWPPAMLISVLVFIHSLCTLYPSTYNHYMSDGEKINELLRKNIDWEEVKHKAQEHFSQLNINHLSSAEFKTQMENIATHMIQSHKQGLREKIEEKKGLGYVFKEEPSTAITTTWQSLIGAYFGSQVIAPLLIPLSSTPPTLLMSLCGLMGALSFGSLFYKAERNRVSDKLILAELETIENKKNASEKTGKPTETIKQSSSAPLADSAALLITALNSTAAITATIGTSSKLHASKLQTALAAATATQSGLNSFFFNYGKVKDTLRSFLINTPSDTPVESIDEWHEVSFDKDHDLVVKKVEESPPLISSSSDGWVEVNNPKNTIELPTFRPA